MLRSNQDYQGPDRYDRNSGMPEDPADSLLKVGLVFALCAFLASFTPMPVALLALEGLLSWAAIGFALKALITGERWSRHRLTAWDQSLMMTAAGMATGLFVDPSALATANVAAPEPTPM